MKLFASFYWLTSKVHISFVEEHRHVLAILFQAEDWGVLSHRYYLRSGGSPQLFDRWSCLRVASTVHADDAHSALAAFVALLSLNGS